MPVTINAAYTVIHLVLNNLFDIVILIAACDGTSLWCSAGTPSCPARCPTGQLLLQYLLVPTFFLKVINLNQLWDHFGIELPVLCCFPQQLVRCSCLCTSRTAHVSILTAATSNVCSGGEEACRQSVSLILRRYVMFFKDSWGRRASSLIGKIQTQVQVSRDILNLVQQKFIRQRCGDFLSSFLLDNCNNKVYKDAAFSLQYLLGIEKSLLN